MDSTENEVGHPLNKTINTLFKLTLAIYELHAHDNNAPPPDDYESIASYMREVDDKIHLRHAVASECPEHAYAIHRQALRAKAFPVRDKDPFKSLSISTGDTFPRVVPDARDKISCFKDGVDLIRDRRTVMKIGRYLSNVLGLDENSRTYKAALRVCGDAPDLFWARSRRDIRRVYLHGPSSCMAHSADSYSADGAHPVECYATEDIGVAYTKDNDNDINARGVCNMKAKTFARLYGDVNSLYLALTAHGFVHSSHALKGCRILHLENENGRHIQPYIDYCVKQDYVTGEVNNRGQIEVGSDVYEGMYRVVGDPDSPTYITDHETGVSDYLKDADEDEEQCTGCDTWSNPVDLISVVNGDLVCTSCLDEHYVRAITRYSTRCYALRDDCIYFEGEWYDTGGNDGNARGWYGLVSIEDEWYHESDARLIDGEWYRLDDVFRSDVDGEWYLSTYAVDTIGGKHTTDDCIELFDGSYLPLGFIRHTEELSEISGKIGRAINSTSHLAEHAPDTAVLLYDKDSIAHWVLKSEYDDLLAEEFSHVPPPTPLLETPHTEIVQEQSYVA